ncbi:MAG: hypothetical protein KDI82_11345 [Gammaproteobacteria bacterium]|nr:hypothetical protein [Gammaproteobacteria bacterium]
MHSPVAIKGRVARVAAAWGALCASCLVSAPGHADDLVASVAPDTGLKSWSYEGDSLAIELLQVPPDFIRASYARRGLPPEVREAVATRCVFGTIVRNIGDQALSYRVADWRYRAADGVEHPIKTKSEWLEEWHGMGVRFSWSILADDATFEVGDWIQGFTTMPEPHGSTLALTVAWSVGGEHYEKTLAGLECAPAPE